MRAVSKETDGEKQGFQFKIDSTVVHLFKKYLLTAYCVPGTIDAWATAVNKIAKISVLKELIFYCRLTETDINVINKLH